MIRQHASNTGTPVYAKKVETCNNYQKNNRLDHVTCNPTRMRRLNDIVTRIKEHDNIYKLLLVRKLTSYYSIDLYTIATMITHQMGSNNVTVSTLIATSYFMEILKHLLNSFLLLILILHDHARHYACVIKYTRDHSGVTGVD